MTGFDHDGGGEIKPDYRCSSIAAVLRLRQKQTSDLSADSVLRKIDLESVLRLVPERQ
jgi:hypothetical protein